MNTRNTNEKISIGTRTFYKNEVVQIRVNKEKHGKSPAVSVWLSPILITASADVREFFSWYGRYFPVIKNARGNLVITPNEERLMKMAELGEEEDIIYSNPNATPLPYKEKNLVRRLLF